MVCAKLQRWLIPYKISIVSILQELQSVNYQTIDY